MSTPPRGPSGQGTGRGARQRSGRGAPGGPAATGAQRAPDGRTAAGATQAVPASGATASPGSTAATASAGSAAAASSAGSTASTASTTSGASAGAGATGVAQAPGARGPGRRQGRPDRKATNTAPGGRPARSTPQMLRRLSALGLLAGVLTGAASFGAITIGESTARTDAATLATASSATRALTDIDVARGQATSAYLGASGASAADVQEAVADAAVSLAALRPASEQSAAAVEQAQRALTGYAATSSTAVSAGSTDRAAGQRLQAADAALAQATNTVSQLAFEGRTTTGSTVATLLPILVGGAGTVLLAGTGVWLARKTRRVINPPLLVGTLLVAGSLALGVVATAAPATAISAEAGTGYLSDTAAVRAAAGQARAAELSAVLPGADVAASSTAANDARNRVDSLLAAGPTAFPDNIATSWRSYAAQSGQVLGTAGSNATAAATAATTTSAAAYSAFAAELPAVNTSAPDPATPDPAAPWAWLSLLAGIAGGVLAWIGLDRRLKDYR